MYLSHLFGHRGTDYRARCIRRIAAARDADAGTAGCKSCAQTPV